MRKLYTYNDDLIITHTSIGSDRLPQVEIKRDGNPTTNTELFLVLKIEIFEDIRLYLWVQKPPLQIRS